MHEVEKRIRAGHGGWPHPGKMPAACQARPYPKATVTWSPVSTGSLYNYLHSPALFGRYRYDASALKRKKRKIPREVDAVAAPSVKPKLDRRAADVDVPDAFRSWFAPEEERVVRRVLSGGGRNFCQKNQENPTDSLYHAVGTLRCGMEVAPGRRCGRKMMAYMLPSGSDSRILRYKSGGCRQTRMPHYVEVSGALDWQVLQILIDVFRPDALKDMAANLSVQRNSSREEGRALAIQLVRAERKRDSAEMLAVEAKAEELAAKRAHDEAPSEDSRREFEDKQEAVTRWTERASLAGRKIRELKESRAKQGRQLDAYEEVTDEELQRCVELGVDLPRLIERVRGVPAALQRIVECLTSEVWLKKLGSGVYEVTVEFPSGESVARIFLDHTRCVPQPTRVLAAGRLAAGVEPADIAAELARHPAPTGQMTCALDEEDVVGVALMHRYFETEAAREGEHASVEDLAARTGESHERVAAVILAGELGPARWNHGMLVVRPSETELHRALPEFALREVARVNGIAPAPLVSSSVLYRANRSLPAWRIELPLKECALYQDAHRKRYFLREEVERTDLSMRVNEKEAEEARAALAAAVTALGRSELRPENFHPCVTVVRQLGPRFGDVSPARIKRAVRRGKVPAVRCLGIADTGRLYPNLLFVHVPPPVMSATSVDVVLGWMARQEGERPPRPGRRRKPDIQLHTELQA